MLLIILGTYFLSSENTFLFIYFGLRTLSLNIELERGCGKNNALKSYFSFLVLVV